MSTAQMPSSERFTDRCLVGRIIARRVLKNVATVEEVRENCTHRSLPFNIWEIHTADEFVHLRENRLRRQIPLT